MASHCGGFSYRQAQALERVGFSSWGAWAQQLWHVGLVALWNLPGPGIEPMSSALAGGCLITRPPGKS